MSAPRSGGAGGGSAPPGPGLRAGRGVRRRLRAAWMRWAPRSFALRARPDDRELGWVGEELAARALRERGLRPVARRLRTPRGELDLVARDGAVLVVVEVKAGRSPPGRRARWTPADRVRWRDRRRLAAAARWLAARRGAPRWRVDVVEVLVEPGVGVRVRHAPGRPASARPASPAQPEGASRGVPSSRDPGRSQID